MVNYQKDQIKKGKSTELTGRVDLMNHIETIANQRTQIPDNGLKSIRSNRQAERAKRRDEATQEEITNVSGITTE
jgi:hypothetical protein